MSVKRVCQCCGAQFDARQADVNRGWAKFCSKRCKAIKQEAQTGQYAAMPTSNATSLHDDQSWDAHKGEW